ncbi:MAG: aminotransferase class III-fold pyridoxal phosphate-dependent enzyme, partial [Candidatus Thorarchaeota archaeon]
MLSEPGTFSKNPTTWGYEEDLRVVSADNVDLTLSDDQTYLTWTFLGSSLLGYRSINLPLVQTACFPYYLEDQVAEKIVSVIGSRVPGWKNEKLAVRFGLSGSDATTMAIRLARAVTGRSVVVCFKGHYHGWGDWSIARTTPAYGIPEYHYLTKPYSTSSWARVKEIEWGDPQDLWEATSRIYTMDEVAAVTFEHPLEAASAEWYSALREACDKSGALLIADEVVTGLRYATGGACEFYGIVPDLICLGKGLGNGHPISALVGPN